MIFIEILTKIPLKKSILNFLKNGMRSENFPKSFLLMYKNKNYTVTAIVDENPQNEMKEYIRKTKELYGTLMQFLSNSDSNENYFQDLINTICQQKHEENCEQFEEFLQLIANVSNNYHREKSFFQKIYQIFDNYEVRIKQTFSNNKIFDIFQSNKTILLFLFQKEIITIDENIYNELQYKIERSSLFVLLFVINLKTKRYLKTKNIKYLLKSFK